jgi:small subunit ribosomal protein S4
MARYTGPTTRISRRFGTYVLGSAKVLERRNFPPGQHGPKSRRKLSEYAIGLNEKQKRERGVTGERFLQLLETRLDSVIYLLGFAKSRAQARQLVNHGHVKVNGHKVDIASYTVLAGDTVEIKANNNSRQIATRALEENRARVVPGWLTRNDEALSGVITRLPARDEMDPSINEQLIVEYYSRF